LLNCKFTFISVATDIIKAKVFLSQFPNSGGPGETKLILRENIKDQSD